MSKSDSTATEHLNVDYMRSLVKQYSELGQWTSAFFWADAAAAAAGDGTPSGDDIWLLASTMLARGELHRAAHTIVSRNLHKCHLLCLGVAMRAYLAAKEPSTALSLQEECDPTLQEPRNIDQTHNRALCGVLVTRARALAALERRDAACAALAAALQADVACYEAFDLLLEYHCYTPKQERTLLDSLPLSRQLGAAEAALVAAAYRARVLRYAPVAAPAAGDDGGDGDGDEDGGDSSERCAVERARRRTAEARTARAARLAASGHWTAALKILEALDPWSAGEQRAACLVAQRRAAPLFALAHALVAAAPHCWRAWFAVGAYYYLIGKNEFARRYLSKAKTLAPGAGCVWLAYGHSFAADNEHDQAMAAYFKACQLMPGCHLPPMYVGVQCAVLGNLAMAQRFLLRAARLHADPEWECAAGSAEAAAAAEAAGGAGAASWRGVLAAARDPAVAHEAGAAAWVAGAGAVAALLFERAVELRGEGGDPALQSLSAASLDALGHVCRKQGRHADAVGWHRRALAVRPHAAATYAAIGLAQALSGQAAAAAASLHAALARAPDDAVALALLDKVVDALDYDVDDEDVPQFPFPAVSLPPPPAPAAPAPAAAAPAAAAPAADHTLSDMSMSFD